ncbi:MAG: hypothetical protein H3C68_05235 [Deltaproteobacteria bacterium]|nr:hypothetical protein [Deltaproteobacteria bacterium]MBZ0220132.1 hypothetical protein [Deltaproteobacteria bacterium]
MGRPRPHQFSRKKLVRKLGSNELKKSAENFFGNQLHTIEDVVTKAVAGSTFRAFRSLPERPSVVFRTWAANHLCKTFKDITAIKSVREYDKYLKRSSSLLCKEWKCKMKTSLDDGRSLKLFNLVMKKLMCFSKLKKTNRTTLLKLLHVPLDSYTIVGLKKILSDTRIIRTSDTMRCIQTPEDYIFFQKCISKIAGEAKVPPIYYDILAWDMAHTKTK